MMYQKTMFGPEFKPFESAREAIAARADDENAVIRGDYVGKFYTVRGDDMPEKGFAILGRDWIGFAAHEVSRAVKAKQDVAWQRIRFPMLENDVERCDTFDINSAVEGI